MMTKISYSGYRFPPEIIQQAIWIYVRFTLSFRDVEDLLANPTSPTERDLCDFGGRLIATSHWICVAWVCANACSADQAPCAAVGEAQVCVMFLRSKIRRKDGKDHRAWSVVENRRVHDGRVVQRQVLYLGEINDSQRAAWSKAIEVFDEGAGQSKQI